MDDHDDDDDDKGIMLITIMVLVIDGHLSIIGIWMVLMLPIF